MEMPGRLVLLDSARLVSRLSSDTRRTNAFQIPRWQRTRRPWHAATPCVCESVNLRGKRWAPPPLQIDSNECGGARSFRTTKELTILLGGRPRRRPFIRRVVLIPSMSAGITSSELHITHTHSSKCGFYVLKMSHYRIYRHTFWVTKMLSAPKDFFKNVNETSKVHLRAVFHGFSFDYLVHSSSL